MAMNPRAAFDVIARGFGIRIEPAPVSRDIEPPAAEGQADVPPRKRRGRPRKVKT